MEFTQYYSLKNRTSQHILGTASNLLGFCLFVIASLHITDKASTTYLDEFTAIIALLLILSCLFSFISIRTLSLKLEKRAESIADNIFLIALSGIALIILCMIFGVIN